MQLSEKQKQMSNKDAERKKNKSYLFWQPPSLPRSSEKFPRFHKLNHKKRRHSPIKHRQKRRGEKDKKWRREREAIFSSAIFFSWPNNLIICLHSALPRPAPSHTHSRSLASSFLFLSLLQPLRLSCSPQPRSKPSLLALLLLSNPRGGRTRVSWRSVRRSGGAGRRWASLFGKWPWMETNGQIEQPGAEPSHHLHCDTAHLTHTHTSFPLLGCTAHRPPFGEIHRSERLVQRETNEL